MNAMEHDAIIDLFWKTLEGDCTPAEQARVKALVDSDEVWEAVYLGLVALYNEGGHIALVDQQLGRDVAKPATMPAHPAIPKQAIHGHRLDATGLSDTAHRTLMSVMGTIMGLLFLFSVGILTSNRSVIVAQEGKALITMANPHSFGLAR